MISLRPFASGVRARILFAFALVAFAMQSLVPAGYMLDRDPGDGRLLVTICSGIDEVPAVLDLETGAVTPLAAGAADGHPEAQTELCDFTLAAGAALPTSPGLEPLPVDLSPAVFTLTESRLPRGPGGQARPPARGPPTLL